jgi:ribonuclease R
VSRSQPPRDRGAPSRARAAPRLLVAVLERKGRFLTAEPAFPPRERDLAGSPGTRGPGRIVVHAGGSGRDARARPGDLVLVQLSPRGTGASVVGVIGSPDVARDAIEAMMLDRGLARRFDESVEREAREAPARVARGEWDRRDLRDLPTFTIDPASARDFDDAISAEALAPGRTRVWVHIADVAAHVPEGSLLDREARRRASSVYVPGAVEPMLPHTLSSDACSLIPGVDRPAVTVELELDGARVTRSAFYRSLIRSDARLEYEQVDRIFAGELTAAEPWAAPLGAAREVAAALQARREQGGALVIDSPEPEFVFDDNGDVTDIRTRTQTESHRLIEHLMIAANEAVAALLQQRGVPTLYRVHEAPDPQRIKRLVDQLATLEVPTPPLPEHMSSTQAAALLGEISRRVEEHVRRSGGGRLALGSLILRSLKQAYYSPTNIGHAGLRSASYCHFTSPIRRYPDIVCHRALLSAVGGGERAPRAGDLLELGAWTSEREREAMTIERDADDIVRCFLLERLLYEQGHGQVFDGEITGLISAGAFIVFGLGPEGGAGDDPPPFEGMLPVRLLGAASPSAGGGTRDSRAGRGRVSGGDRGRDGGAARGRDGSASRGREWWELNQEGTILFGERSGATLRLGDPLEVRVARVERMRGRVDLTRAG